MRPKIQSIQDSATWLISQNDETKEGHEIASENIRSKVTEVVEPFVLLAQKLNDKQDQLNSALVRHLGFNNAYIEFIEQVTELETRVTMLKPLSVKYDVLWKQIDNFESLEKDVSQLAPRYKKIVDDGKKRLRKARKGDKEEIEEKIKEMTKRKENLEKAIHKKRTEVHQLEAPAKDFDEIVEEFEEKLNEAEELNSKIEDVPTDLIRCEQQKASVQVRNIFCMYDQKSHWLGKFNSDLFIEFKLLDSGTQQNLAIGI